MEKNGIFNLFSYYEKITKTSKKLEVNGIEYLDQEKEVPNIQNSKKIFKLGQENISIKGGLTLESFSFCLQSPKIVAKSLQVENAQDSDVEIQRK